MEELKQLFGKEFQAVDPVLLVSVIAGVVVFILELILYSKGVIFSSGEKRLKHAQKMGYTVIAHRVHMNFEDRRNDSGHMERVWVARYEYTFRGIRGQKTMISHHGAPGPTITLYHDGKSSKVYTDAEMRQHKRSFLLIIIPILVMLLVAKLLGYQP